MNVCTADLLITSDHGNSAAGRCDAEVSPDVGEEDEPDYWDEDENIAEPGREAPWDDFGWDFDDEEPEPGHGDFSPAPDDDEDDW